MTRRAALLVLALLCTPILHAAQSTSLTGSWSGSFLITMNGEERPDSIFMSLTQKGNVVSGTAGPNANQQWPIADGKVDGAKVTFVVLAENEMQVKFELTLADGHLKGNANADENGMALAAKVDVTRSK